MSLAVGLRQQSPNFLAAGTGFTEDKFSMDWGAVRAGVSGDYSSASVHFISIFMTL